MPLKIRGLLVILLWIVALGWGGLRPAWAAGPSTTTDSMWSAPVPLIYAPGTSNQILPPPPEFFQPRRQGAASFIITYRDNGTTNAFGDACVTFPEEAKTAFNYAASILSATLQSNVPIRVEACWASLPQYVLGHSGSSLYRGFPNAPQANTWYSSTLADALSGSDLGPSGFDISIAYAVGYASAFYYGTDGNPGSKTDFASVALHELVHGLGFSGSMRVSSGSGSWGLSGYPASYDRFTVDGAGVSLINTSVYPNPSAALGTTLTGGQVYFSGAQARAANGGANVALYAPSTWASGSSYAHLAESFNNTPNALMTYSISNGEVSHSLGPVTQGLLNDVGWAPFAPSNLTLGTVTSTSITLSWSDNSNNETGFEVERSADGVNGWTLVATPAAGATTYTHTGLTPSTPYAFRVRAVHALGKSLYTNTVNATTSLGSPAAPSGLSAAAVSQTQINLAWTDNSATESGFKVERSPDGTSGWSQIGVTAANAVTYQDTGLTAATPYYYRVRATNSGGDSVYTAAASAMTLPYPPSAPIGLGAVSVSQTQINLSWTDGPGESGYKVERSPDGSSGWAQIGTTGANVTAFQNTGLTAGTAYSYRVRAYNAGGDSGYSSTASATTVPPDPAGLAAQVVSQTQINLSWENVPGESGYKVERSPDGSSGWAQVGTTGANVTAFQNTGLAAGTAYSYRVRAYNAGGDSGYSALAGATTLPNPPEAPSGLRGVALSQTEIRLTWNDVGAETGYKVERSPDGSSEWGQIGVTTADVTAYTDSGLSVATPYFYRVRAVNTGGDSPYSTPADATTLPNPPAAPSGLSAAAATYSRIDLTWTDQSSNESGFELERSPDGVSGWTPLYSVPANTTAYADTPLTALTAYYYRVRAVNAGGVSAWSDPAGATTPAQPAVPLPPSGLSAQAVSYNQINLAWTDNSADETGFVVEVSPDGTGGWSLLAVTAADVTSLEVIVLTPNHRFYYRVSARNAAGDSLPTPPAGARTPFINEQTLFFPSLAR